MYVDAYTKVVLTVIAVALTAIAARPVIGPVAAFARDDDPVVVKLTAIETDLAEVAADTALLAGIGTTLATIAEDAALLERATAELAELRTVAIGIAKADFPCTNQYLCGGPQ